MKYRILWTERIRYTAEMEWADSPEKLHEILQFLPGSNACPLEDATREQRRAHDRLRWLSESCEGEAAEIQITPMEQSQ